MPDCPIWVGLDSTLESHPHAPAIVNREAIVIRAKGNYLSRLSRGVPHIQKSFGSTYKKSQVRSKQFQGHHSTSLKTDKHHASNGIP